MSGFGRSTAASNNLISGPPVRSGPGCSAQPGGPHWQPSSSLFTKVPRKRADRMMGSESLASAIMMSSGTPGESVEIGSRRFSEPRRRHADTIDLGRPWSAVGRAHFGAARSTGSSILSQLFVRLFSFISSSVASSASGSGKEKRIPSSNLNVSHSAFSALSLPTMSTRSDMW